MWAPTARRSNLFLWLPLPARFPVPPPPAPAPANFFRSRWPDFCPFRSRYAPMFQAANWKNGPIFSKRELYHERELTFTFAICCRPSVCLSLCLSSVTLVRRTQAVKIFGNISTAFDTLAIRWHPGKILRRSSQGNPSGGGVKCKRGSQIDLDLSKAIGLSRKRCMTGGKLYYKH